MTKKVQLTDRQMTQAVAYLSRPGETYATVAVKLGVPYWYVAGSFRKMNVVMSTQERDNVDATAFEIGLTGGELLMDVFNEYAPLYLKKRKKKFKVVG